MVQLTVLFWFFVIEFAVIGLMRGWAKELLVTFAAILALFMIQVLENFVPFIKAMAAEPGSTIFWMRALILTGLVFFGYQSPNIAKLAGSGRFVRERFQDALLGLFLGALNGYIIFGSLWYYLDSAGYPFPVITAPDMTGTAGEAIRRLLEAFAPHLLGIPQIYFAVAIAFAFVLVVFI